jgi:hypothetical protein
MKYRPELDSARDTPVVALPPRYRKDLDGEVKRIDAILSRKMDRCYWGNLALGNSYLMAWEDGAFNTWCQHT